MKLNLLLPTMLLSAICFGTKAQNFTDKVKLQKGQVIQVHTIDTTDLVQKRGGEEMPMKTFSASELEVSALEASGNELTMQQVLNAMKLHFEGFGQVMDYDSKDPAKQEGMMAANMKEQIGKKDTNRFTLTGQLIEDEDKPTETEKGKGKGKGMMRRMQQGFNAENCFLLIPADAKVGTGWKTDKTKEGIKTQTIYFLDKLEGDLATVSFKRKSKGTTTSEFQGMSSTVEVDNLSEGLIVVNIQTGLVSLYEESLKMNSKVNMMGQEMPNTGTVRTHQTLTLK